MNDIQRLRQTELAQLRAANTVQTGAPTQAEAAHAVASAGVLRAVAAVSGSVTGRPGAGFGLPRMAPSESRRKTGFWFGTMPRARAEDSRALGVDACSTTWVRTASCSASTACSCCNSLIWNAPWANEVLITNMATKPIPRSPVTKRMNTPRLARSGRNGDTNRKFGRACLRACAPRVAYSVASALFGSRSTVGSGVTTCLRAAELMPPPALLLEYEPMPISGCWQALFHQRFPPPG